MSCVLTVVILCILDSDTLAETANPFCQLGFGKQKFTTKVKQATLAPVWKEEFRLYVPHAISLSLSLSVSLLMSEERESVQLVELKMTRNIRIGGRE